MKIQPIIPQLNNNNQTPQFTGGFDAFTSVLRFLDTNQAWGANSVDLCSMVIPRTTIDFVNRGPDAGLETGRRESMGTFNHSMVGVYGSVAGFALAHMLNKNFGIKAHKIFADNEAFEFIANSYKNNADVNYEKHFKNIFKNLETMVDGEVKHIAEKDVNTLASKFNLAMVNNQAPEFINKELLKYTKSVITQSAGSENNFKFSGSKNTFSLENGIKSIYNVTKAAILKDEKGISTDEFIRYMKRFNIKRSVAGLAIAAGIGMSTQPINMYLTKKKTGSDGFVGVEGRKKDTSKGFFFKKVLSASAFALMALSTITTKPSKLLNKIQFQGLFPTISQLKLVYGLTIASRLLSARDKDELRESTVKDTLGFLNLLVLGTLVTKGVARCFNKSLINVAKEDSKNFFKWLTKSSLKTRDEVLYTALKEKGISTVKDGKLMKFSELVKLADKDTKAKLRALNISQIAGYLYSALVLGIGVPKLNIWMTNKSEAKRKALLEAQKGKPDGNNTFTQMLKPENLEFLSRAM